MIDGKAISSPQKMFGWASENIKGVNFEFMTAAEIESNAESYSLKTSFENTKSIPVREVSIPLDHCRGLRFLPNEFLLMMKSKYLTCSLG